VPCPTLPTDANNSIWLTGKTLVQSAQYPDLWHVEADISWKTQAGIFQQPGAPYFLQLV